MKKKWILCGLCGVVGLAAGAFLVEKTIVEPRTVSTWQGLHELCLSGSTPPLPDIDPVAVYGQWKTGDFSFMDENWFRTESLVAYVSEETKELAHLDLPVTIRIYRYPPTAAVYILSSEDGTNFVGEAAFADEPLVDETFETRSVNQQQRDLLFALWNLRVVYEVTLKSEEDAWSDLLSVKQTFLSASSAQTGVSAPQVMMMTASVTDFRIVQDGTNLSVNLPDEFAGADLNLLACSNLVEAAWSSVLQTHAATNGILFLAHAEIPDPISSGSSSTNSGGGSIPPLDGTNTSSSASTTNSSAAVFYKVTAVSTNDTDSDSLGNLAEYELGTDYQDSDSDDDGMADGWEVQYGFDPLDGTDAAGDPDGDGYSNATEYAVGADPLYYNPAPEISVISPQNQTFLP